MKFGPTALAEATGAILAHSLTVGAVRLKKGRRLSAADVARLAEAGVREVTAARLDADDLDEDAAAAAVAAALAPDFEAAGLMLSAAFTGRVNLYATRAGLFILTPEAVAAVNAVDEAITLATLPSETWVEPRRMLATVKIIPYAAPRAAVEAASRAAAQARAAVAPPALGSTRLILTRTPGYADRLLHSGADAVRKRLAALSLPAPSVEQAPHETAALAERLGAGAADLTLILAASATTDRRDVAPAAIEAAGGRLIRVGMPVDPGNLLALGEIDGRPVLALPGCARSPALNGADFVLERLAAGRSVSSADIAAMGAGGLLKEIASRPSPRAAARAASRARVSGLLLAAGGSSRYAASRGDAAAHKLLAEVAGEPLLRRSARRLAGALGQGLDEVVVVLGARAEALRPTLEGLAVRIVEAPGWAEGMAASLRAGLGAIAPEADAALVALADMPEVDAALVRRLVAAYDVEEGREIVRPSFRGRPGHPALFGRRFFEALGALQGDEGGRSIVAAHGDRLVEVAVDTDAPLLDLDDAAAFEAYARRVQAGAAAS